MAFRDYNHSDADQTAKAALGSDHTCHAAVETMATVGGACSYANCGCGGFVKDDYGNCASCSHPANAHY